MNLEQAAEDYRRIGKAIRYLEENVERQPELKEVAAAASLSEYHFQRLFSRWVGISPKRFLQFLTKEYAKEILQTSRDLLSVTYDTGLSSPGRLHDLFVNCEAMTPGEYKQHGKGVVVRYGIHASPFGDCLLALTDRGICSLAFMVEGTRTSALSWLGKQWPDATLLEDSVVTRAAVKQIFDPAYQDRQKPLSLLLKGTNFQIKVWEALMRIPPGYILSYEDVAAMVGNPKAVRAVAGAIARNPISYVIPCHRVIRKMGIIHEYRWGRTRKKALIGWEAAKKFATIDRYSASNY